MPSRPWLWATPILAGLFLAITGGVLIGDLERPKRFYYIFTRPQWRSRLVKGAFAIAAYSVVLAVHFVSALAGADLLLKLAAVGLPLAVLTAVYTAYLFAQAKARDLWQNPPGTKASIFADYVLPMGHSSERHDIHSYETHDGRRLEGHSDEGQKQLMATVSLDRKDSEWKLGRLKGAGPWQSSDPDTQRIWWSDVGGTKISPSPCTLTPCRACTAGIRRCE